MTVLAVIQARMGSRRLPGKVMAELCGRPLIARLVERIRQAANVDHLVLATTTAADDDVLAAWAAETELRVVRGPESDVLARFIAVLDACPAEIVVRVTADNPFTDAEQLDAVVARLRDGTFDYVHAPGLPDGAGVDAFTAMALRRCHAGARTPYQREHINAFVLDNPRDFRIGVHAPSPPLRRPEIRLSVDTAEDLARTRAILAGMAESRPTLAQIVAFVDRTAGA